MKKGAMKGMWIANKGKEGMLNTNIQHPNRRGLYYGRVCCSPPGIGKLGGKTDHGPGTEGDSEKLGVRPRHFFQKK